MNIKVDRSNQYIQVSGDLVASTVMEALRSFKKECKGLNEWVVDLTHVERVDSTAIALLIELKRSATSNKKSLRFIYLPESLLTIARLSQVDGLLTESV